MRRQITDLDLFYDQQLGQDKFAITVEFIVPRNTDNVTVIIKFTDKKLKYCYEQFVFQAHDRESVYHSKLMEWVWKFDGNLK